MSYRQGKLKTSIDAHNPTAVNPEAASRRAKMWFERVRNALFSRRRIQIPILLATMAISSFALGRMTDKNTDKANAKKSSVEQQLIDLDRHWLEASSNADTDFLKGLFADKMFEVQSGGHVATGAEMLQSIIRKGKDEGTVDDIQVRGLYSGTTAILTDRRTIKRRPDAQSSTGNADGPYFVMRVYVKLNGKWQAVAAAMTPMPLSSSN
jgi:hypothetical protein